jgi:hypothetical protein
MTTNCIMMRVFIAFYPCFISRPGWHVVSMKFNPLNAKLNPICHFLALLGAHPILHVSRIRVNIAAYMKSWMMVGGLTVLLLKMQVCWDDAISLGEWFLTFQRRMVVPSSFGSRARRWRHYSSVGITCPETWRHILDDLSLVREKLFGKFSFSCKFFWNGIWLLRLLSFWILFIVWCFKITQHCRNWMFLSLDKKVGSHVYWVGSMRKNYS